ncbi:hypothetical protein N0V93_002034 [Gnomoniopsis smithogilvyi]|uniref:Uncharacterized protein n=1 Tax=Gnomoniopsis smithogilvyi TaxID=1191159 RepID=A0A9W8Z721_9PEZI|nr:hypothetical protein N0V93_002034 [Gnomoniopsis smithogilvyi]
MPSGAKRQYPRECIHSSLIAIMTLAKPPAPAGDKRPVSADMEEDHATAHLILQVQIDDLETHIRGSGNRLKNDFEDFDLAMQLYRTELEAASKAVAIRQKAASSNQTFYQHGTANETFKGPETPTQNIRSTVLAADSSKNGFLAESISGPADLVQHVEEGKQLNDDAAHRKDESAVDEDPNSQSQDPGTTDSPEESKTQQYKCAVCMDEFLATPDRLHRLQCVHY